ncbi:hypothetical protein HQO38_18650 [Rhodococcus fascians]|nr:hypothetical protein [Rhodococcus fascians]MBY4140961.1 hypothetical protein [Rhodococcus fascians]MBY4219625.1 hypothetical protein [Rhodococcus fascians]MBY4221934.1 hypothetical protein [Rhodococcus fascians]MBY4233935.1 hypothetical protein [Rhodococcus fascians]
MATAVVRIVVDPSKQLSDEAYWTGLQDLRNTGLEVIASAEHQSAGQSREVELIVEDHGVPLVTESYLAQCRSIFGVDPVLGVVTYVSRGTAEDALGVLTRFGVTGQVTVTEEDGNEVFTVTLPEVVHLSVPESRLHTALEAALNAEVRMKYLP